jgi:hypothetical protein
MISVTQGMSRFGINEKQAMPKRIVQTPKQETQPSVIGSSFGKIVGEGTMARGVGGGVPNMLGLQQSSMMLADAAARRDRETMQFEFDLEERSRMKELQISKTEKDIGDLEREIREWEQSPPSINKQAEIDKRKQSLSSKKAELDRMLRG